MHKGELKNTPLGLKWTVWITCFPQFHQTTQFLCPKLGSRTKMSLCMRLIAGLWWKYSLLKSKVCFRGCSDNTQICILPSLASDLKYVARKSDIAHLYSLMQCVLSAFLHNFTNSSHCRSILNRTQKTDWDFQLVSLSFFALLSFILAIGSSCCSQWEMRQDIKLLISSLLAASVSYLSNSTSILYKDYGHHNVNPCKGLQIMWERGTNYDWDDDAEWAVTDQTSDALNLMSSPW